MTELTWPQVHTWRLAQHGLAPRLSTRDVARDVVEAVTRAGGIQAQVMSAAELAVCARVAGCSPRDVQAALFDDHTLARTWAMRATLHLLPTSELPLYVAARNWRRDASWLAYFAEFGITSAQQDAFLAAIPHVLEQGPLTRPQLADAVAKHAGAGRLRDFILSSSWGTPLKPSAYRGDLCFGPGQGKTGTFMNPRAWIGNWESIEPRAALQEFARRYLRAYGPATTEDFRFWWGCGKTEAKALFQSLADELVDVEVEGWRAVALRETLPRIQAVEPAERVLLLPLFDAYTIGAPRDCEAFLAPARKRAVFNLQGWTFAVVLVNGAIQGVWRATSKRASALIQISLFGPLTPAVRSGIEAEARRLSDLLEKSVTLEYAEIF